MSDCPSDHLSTHLSIYLSIHLYLALPLAVEGDRPAHPKLPAAMGYDGLAGWDEDPGKTRCTHRSWNKDTDKSSGVGRAASAATRKKKRGYCNPVSAIISLQITGQAPHTVLPKPESALPVLPVCLV